MARAAAASPDPRDVNVYEIVDVIESLMDLTRDDAGNIYAGCAQPHRKAEAVINKLVGPERESEARWSSRHIRVDVRYAGKLAESLAISHEEAIAYFLGEPIKRAEKVAAWALEKADAKILEQGGVHGQRGRIIADMLSDWARDNQCGKYRRAQPEPVGTPREAKERQAS